MTNIILCGGSGTRLWPLSRILMPKQFVKQSKKICVIGLGYIGLSPAALLANRGEIHIVEPELDTFVQAAVNSGKLKADLKPTPFHEGYIPNVDYIVSATKVIAPYVVTFIVAHKEFKSLAGELGLDFCGVLN